VNDGTQPALTGIEPATPPADPVADKARQVLERAQDAERRPPGRPRGSKTKNRRKPAGGPSAARTEATREGAAAPPDPVPPPTEAEVRGLGKMLGAAWRMMGVRMRRRPLTAAEELELAEAAHPVMQKYGGGALEKWGAEIALAFTVWGLWEATEIAVLHDPDLDGSAAPEPDDLELSRGI
jgi:hypothetical protein